MAQLSAARVANPRVGLYLGIFTSLFVALGLLVLLVEQLGTSGSWLGIVLLAGSVALFAAFGLSVTTREPADFFAAGRRVPAAIAGVTTAVTALGGVGVVSLTGALFIMGTDAFAVLLGIPAGLVVMAVLMVPFLRKFGAYTLPGYLGERLDSRVLRVVAATFLAVPVLLLTIAEMKLAGLLAGKLVGAPAAVMSLALAACLLLMLVGGGMRAQAWSGAAQAVALILAMVVPVTIAALALSNLPLPQMIIGNVSRGILRLELFRGVPVLQAAPWLVDIPGNDLEALGRRFLQMFGSIGPSAYSFVSLAVMCGIAGLPSILMRSTTTPSVLASRVSMAWAVLTTAFLILTLTAVAVFLRAYVTEQVLAQPADRMPGWFQSLMQDGAAALSVKGNTLVSLGAISFTRDNVLAALPVALGLPQGLVALALLSGVIACLAATSAHLMTLAASVSEDVLILRDADAIAASRRLMLVRGALVAITMATAAASLLPADPLMLALWGWTLSAATSFPILVLSVLWKRLTAAGAMVGMAAGFATAVSAILMTQSGALSIDAPLPGVIGAIFAFGAAIVASLVTKATTRPALELLRDMRVPGGETLMDRQRRLLKLKLGD